MKNILVIGSLNMDYTLNVLKMPNIGETILANSINLSQGGKGANQAFSAALLGGSVSMIGAVGNDENGKILVNNLKKANIDTNAIKIIEDVPSGTAYIVVDNLGNNNIVVVPGANDYVDKELIDLHIDLISRSDFIMLQMEIPLKTVEYVAKIASEQQKVVILDPAPIDCCFNKTLLNYIDIIKPNEIELSLLANMDTSTEKNAIKAAQSLLKYGVSYIVITRGEKGSIIVSKDSVNVIPADKVDAIDTTGAGDCFLGALCTFLSEGFDIESSVRFASKASSISVSRKGAQTSMPNRRELTEIIYR